MCFWLSEICKLFIWLKLRTYNKGVQSVTIYYNKKDNNRNKVLYILLYKHNNNIECA